MVDRPTPKFFHRQTVKVLVKLPLLEPTVMPGTIVGLEWTAVSRLGATKEWFYFVAPTPTGQAVLVSESKLVLGDAVMSHDEFKQLVAHMRQAQKDYFRSRCGDALLLSKKLEREVDSALQDDGQQELFAGEPDA